MSSTFPVGVVTGMPTLAGPNLVYVDCPDSATTGMVHSWNIDNQSESWHYALSGMVFGEVAVDTTNAYVGDVDGVIHAVSLTSGTQQWTYRAYCRIWTSPVVTSSGLILVTDTCGTLYALNATGTIAWICSHMTDNQSSSTSPVISDDGQIAVYGVRSVAYLNSVVYGVRLSDGALLWQSTVALIPGDIFHPVSLCTGAGQVFVPCSDRTVHAFNVTTGQSNWVYTTLDDLISGPACDGTAVYFGDLSGNYCAVGAHTGTMLWSITPGAVLTGTVISEGLLYFGAISDDPRFGRMCCADPSLQGAGAYTIKAPTPGQMYAPAVQDQIAYCATSILEVGGSNMCTLPFDWGLSTISVTRTAAGVFDDAAPSLAAAAADNYQGVVTVQNEQRVIQPNLPLTVWATGPINLTVGSTSYQINVEQPATISTDAQGQLVFTAQSSTSPLPNILLSAPFLPQDAAYIIYPLPVNA